MAERFWHESGTQAVLFGDGFYHEAEKTHLVGGFQTVIKIPVDLKLAVGVFMVVLIRPPAHFNHVGADFRNHIIATQQGGLVVTGLGLGVASIRNVGAVFIDQVKFRLNTGF